jgi:alginate O-acetyltransferase complex protein AlgI
MLFHAPVFMLVFLPLVLVAYHATRRYGGARAALGVLLLASIVFYSWWDPRFVPLLLGSAAFNFLLGRAISARRRAGTPTGALFAFGIAANLGTLGFFKYANFFILNVAAVTGIEAPVLEIALPLAISFFTFQQIAFLVDARSGVARDPNPLSYLLFVTFFPQLIAGPIVHHREMMPQFDGRGTDRDTWDDLTAGLISFCIGLFKKTVIADRMGFWSDRIFDTAALGAPVPAVEAWTGALAFTFQIYFDFSGYTDMAIGLALMFGVRLPVNFASPYKAVSIIDFWRRWHITLSRFLRDYLYIPLGGNRHGRPRRYANLMIVMLLGGLWHGAAWTFVLWGAMHGAFLVVNHAWRRVAGDRFGGSAATWLARGITFLAVVVAWVMFRATSFDAAQNIYAGMLGLNGIVLPLHYLGALGPLGPTLEGLGVTFGLTPNFGGGEQVVWLAATLAAVWFLPNTQTVMRRARPVLADTVSQGGRLAVLAGRALEPRLITALALGVGAAYLALRQIQGQPGEFIYFRF